VENVLLEWFQQSSSLNYRINGGVLTEKAMEFAMCLKIIKCSGSVGWTEFGVSMAFFSIPA